MFFFYAVQVYVVDHCENITQKPGLVVTHISSIVVQGVLLDEKCQHVNRLWSSPTEISSRQALVCHWLYDDVIRAKLLLLQLIH